MRLTGSTVRGSKEAAITAQDIVSLAREACEDKKASDIRVLDVSRSGVIAMGREQG